MGHHNNGVFKADQKLLQPRDGVQIQMVGRQNLSKTIDGVKVLDNISFILNREDKVALVGPNEQAKTVLFKILAGEMEPDFSSALFLDVACLDLEALAENLWINSWSSLIFSSFFRLASFIWRTISWLDSYQKS